MREHVGALSSILTHWKKKAKGDSNEYIIRRYVATSRGIMITYPATVVRDDYEPAMQSWYFIISSKTAN